MCEELNFHKYSYCVRYWYQFLNQPNRNQKRHGRSKSGTCVQFWGILFFLFIFFIFLILVIFHFIESYSLLQCRCSCQFFVHSSLYTEPLIWMPEPLPETGILANHSSYFMLLKRDSHTVGLTDPIMEVAPRPKNQTWYLWHRATLCDIAQHCMM